jgi:hypothetical protein
MAKNIELVVPLMLSLIVFCILFDVLKQERIRTISGEGKASAKQKAGFALAAASLLAVAMAMAALGYFSCLARKGALMFKKGVAPFVLFFVTSIAGSLIGLALSTGLAFKWF